MTLDDAVAQLKEELGNPNLVISASDEDDSYFYLWTTIDGKHRQFPIKKQRK